MAEAGRSEHSDWHFADDLQRQGGAVQSSQRTSAQPASALQGSGGSGGGGSTGGRAGRNKRQQSPVTIDALLSRHRRKSNH